MRIEGGIAITENHIARGGKSDKSKSKDQNNGGTTANDKKSAESTTKTETLPDLVLIGGNCQVKGEIRNCHRLEVEGRLEGDFEIEELVVKKSGKIIGTIKAKTAEIHGIVEGNIIVEELLDVRKSGMVSGDVDYGQLTVSAGGQLIGSLDMDSKTERDPTPVKKAETAQSKGASTTRSEERKSAPINRIIDSWMSYGKNSRRLDV